ncbi:MAG: hypothetical protein JNJ54_36640 [Myxococcaceae bacterium]|nr:hypothetical protein [Myxococcaceae bacterium]
MATCALLAVVLLAADAGLEPPEVTALAEAAASPAPLALDAGHPADPFAAEYLPPGEQEVGPGKGQVRVFGLGGVTSGPDLLATFTVESLHLAFLAVRGSVTAELSNFGPPHPHLLSARFGVGLHVAPYRRVDASVFVDAGLAVIDLFTPQRTATPLLSPGLALEVAFTAHLFLRAEGQLTWLRAPASLLRWAGLLGLGWTL